MCRYDVPASYVSRNSASDCKLTHPCPFSYWAIIACGGGGTRMYPPQRGHVWASISNALSICHGRLLSWDRMATSNALKIRAVLRAVVDVNFDLGA